MTTTTVTKRAATGALTGLALGDALGFPTEFKDVPSILATYGDWRSLELPEPAIVTDDTQMTLALGRGLRTAMDRGTLGPKRLERPVREEFVGWWRSPENNRAPGNTCLRACHLLSGDERPWQDASQIHSKGCGANMRVAPVGLAPGLTDEQRAGAAQLQSALTHGHPTALAASDLTAHAVRLLAEGAEPAGLIGLLRSYAYENRTRYHESWLGDLWTRAGDASRSTSSRAAGTSAWRSWGVSRRPCGPSRQRPTRAGPPARAGSPRRPWRPACSASCSSSTSR